MQIVIDTQGFVSVIERWGKKSNTNYNIPQPLPLSAMIEPLNWVWSPPIDSALKLL